MVSIFYKLQPDTDLLSGVGIMVRGNFICKFLIVPHPPRPIAYWI